MWSGSFAWCALLLCGPQSEVLLPTQPRQTHPRTPMICFLSCLFTVYYNKCFPGFVAPERCEIPLNPGALVFVQSILETIVDIFDPLVGMSRGISSTELGERTRRASFADELSTPFSGKHRKAFSRNTSRWWDFFCAV